MLKTLTAAALLAIAGAAFAQSTPSVTPSQTPAVTPSQTPSVTPSQAPVVTPTPVPPPAAVGGLSRCENMIGADKDACLQQERAGTGSTAPGSTTSGTSTQPSAPIGSPTGSVR